MENVGLFEIIGTLSAVGVSFVIAEEFVSILNKIKNIFTWR